MWARLLELLGDITGRRVLDAGCGEGYLSRVLAARGARITGIDLSPRLITLARRQGLLFVGPWLQVIVG